RARRLPPPPPRAPHGLGAGAAPAGRGSPSLGVPRPAPAPRPPPPAPPRREPRADRPEALVRDLRKRPRERLHLGHHALCSRPRFACGLPSDEIVRLDARGPFVDRRDPRVAKILRGSGLLDETHAAVDLDADRGDLDRGLG